LFITFSHLVATTTFVVKATTVVDVEEKGDAAINEIEEDLKVSVTSYGMDENGEIVIDRTINSTQEDMSSIGTTDDSEIIEETYREASNTISDSSVLETPEESVQKNDDAEIEDGIGMLAGENILENMDGSTSDSHSETIENDMEEKINKPSDESQEEEAENDTISALESEMKDKEVEDDVVIGTITTTQEMKVDNGEEIPPASSTLSSKNSTAPESIHDPNHESKEKLDDSSSSPPESTSKFHPEDIEDKAETEGSANNPKKAEITEVEGEQEDTPEMDTTSNGTQLEDEAQGQDENLSSVSEDQQTDDGLELDLDIEAPEVKTIEDESGEGDDVTDQAMIINDENTKDVISEARPLKDHRETETADTNIHEIPTAVTTEVYRGEPWGQYRSTRRIPDLELLRLVFENANKTRINRASGDATSQKVVNNWQKDPLYDEILTTGEGVREPLLTDEHDQKFLDYRSQLLGENDGAASINQSSKSKATNDNEEERQNARGNDNDSNSNSADVNSEFGEGLDDIDKFFEGVNPPDELDVGYGSSIQDVLIDKGKHILLKKIRGVARWLQIGWQTMGRKLEERISQFQLPFQKAEGTTNAESDVNEGAVNSSKGMISNEQRDRIVKNAQEALISAWKVGKQTIELISDLVDGLLDRFDGRNENDSANFEDFNGFDLDNLAKFSPPA
jgi:hypothetical protein